MVAVGFRGKDGQQQGSGKVVGGKRQEHRHNNQIEVMAVAAAVVVAVAAAAAVVALNGSDGQWPGGRQHNNREVADNVR
jgi:hypothetical protein